MKRLSLEKTWSECLKMWRWIATKKRADMRKSVISLKGEWLAKYGYKNVKGDCFFCEYAERKRFERFGFSRCDYCPGRKVKECWHCARRAWGWNERPVKFYEKLIELNKKRLAGKKKASNKPVRFYTPKKRKKVSK